MKIKKIYERAGWVEKLNDLLEYPAFLRRTKEEFLEYTNFACYYDHPEHGVNQYAGPQSTGQITFERAISELEPMLPQGCTRITLERYKKYYTPNKQCRVIAEPHSLLIEKYDLTL